MGDFLGGRCVFRWGPEGEEGPLVRGPSFPARRNRAVAPSLNTGGPGCCGNAGSVWDTMSGRHTRFGPPPRRASKTAGPSARGGGDGPTSEPDMTPRCSNYAHAQCGTSVRRQVSDGSRSAKPDAGIERPGSLGGGNRSAAGPVNIFFYPNGRGPNKRRAGTPKDPGPSITCRTALRPGGPANHATLGAAVLVHDLLGRKQGPKVLQSLGKAHFYLRIRCGF